MAVTLVQGTVGREKVNVMFPLGVPDAAAAGAGKHDGQRMVVVGRVGVFGVDCGFGGGGMELVVGKDSDWLERRRGRLKIAAACRCRPTICVLRHDREESVRSSGVGGRVLACFVRRACLFVITGSTSVVQHKVGEEAAFMGPAAGRGRWN